nr:hypothetical protein GCM10020092_095290 [Actinoplanes digitatis]
MPKFKLPRRSRKALHSAEASARGGLLRNLRVSQKLFVSFGVLSLLVVTIGVADGVALSTTNGQLNKMYNDNLQSVARIGQVRADVQQANLLSTKLILRSPLADVSSVQTAIRRLDAAIDANWAAYSKNPAKGTEADMAAFSEGLTKYRTIRDERLVPAAKANSLGTYLGVQNNYIDPLTSTITVALNNLAGIEDKAAQRQMADARSNATSARLLTMTLMGVALAFAVVIALVVSRAIARPLGQTVKILEALAEGRLDQRLAVRGRDEVGRMAEALNTALDRLTATLRDIAGNVTTLASSSEELTAVASQMNSSAARSADRAQAVSTASGQISSNIATVSAGAEEIGSSITEIALSTSSAADVAGQAVRISTDAGAILQKAGRVLRRDRLRHQDHHRHRRADEPARPQRDDRGRPRRRRGQGLRGRRRRGKGAGTGDGPGDRGHPDPRRRDPERLVRRGRGDRRDRLGHRQDQRNAVRHRGGRRGADGDHQRDEPQRRRGRDRLPADLVERGRGGRGRRGDDERGVEHRPGRRRTGPRGPRAPAEPGDVPLLIPPGTADPRRPSCGLIRKAAAVPCQRPAASFAFIASARAIAPFSGRTITVNSSISPSSPRCRKSQPSTWRPPTFARNTSA